MSKEELLKYLIAEIDLIMHDKDYRFENEDGTWYSRESCRNLTNEEMFEELRTELRQLADLEAKLAESEKKNFELIAKLNLKEHRPAFCTLADRECEALGQVEKLKQQLAEKQKEMEIYRRSMEVWVEKCENHNQDKISFAVEQIMQIREKIDNSEKIGIGLTLDGCYEMDDIFDNQIAKLKKEMK